MDINLKEVNSQQLAELLNDEVDTYLENKRCVNKLEARVQLATRVLDIISLYELRESLDGTLDRSTRAIINRERKRVYDSLKEY